MDIRWKPHLLLTVVTMSMLLLCVTHAQAVSSISARQPLIGEAQQNRTVTLKVDSVLLEDALRAVATQAGLRLTYPSAGLPKRLITLRLDSVPVSQAFVAVLRGTGLRVDVIAPGHAAIVPDPERAKPDQQEKTGSITGRVTDSATGNGVSGVVVSVQETNLSVSTGNTGEYILPQVREGARVLTFRVLGYTSVSRTVQVETGKRSTLRVMLRQTPNMLSGVVTTATGERRKLEVGNAVTSINVDSVMRVAPISSLTDLLETRVPGLTVQRTSGTPGDPSRIRLRGSSSITGSNEPIVIVNGVRMYTGQSAQLSQNQASEAFQNIHATSEPAVHNAPSVLDQIDPNTIETIDVFRGPSAAAMYGSDAANGVIVITTRRGKVGAPRWNISLTSGLQVQPGRYPEGSYLYGRDTMGVIKYDPFCGLIDRDCTVDSVLQFQALNDSRYSILGRGNNQDVSATVSGGVASIQYSLTGSASNTIGLLELPSLEVERFNAFHGTNPPAWMRRPDRYSQWGGSGTVALQVNPHASVTLITDLFKSRQQRSSLQSSLTTLMHRYIDPEILEQNPLLKEFYQRATSEKLTGRTTVQFLWSPVSWLPINGNIGLNTVTFDDQILLPRGMVAKQDSNGRYSISQGSEMTRSMNLFTTVPVSRMKTLITVGINGNASSVRRLNSATGYIPPGVTIPNDFSQRIEGGSIPSSSQSSEALTTFGWFVEPRLNLSSRLFASPGFRLDNNGLSGKDAGLLGLPKMNFSWIASDEPFFPQRIPVNLLRVRAAIGTAGVQPGPTDRLRLYRYVDSRKVNGVDQFPFEVPFNGQEFSLNTLGNTKLRPERSVEIEGGFEVGGWNDRAQLEVTHYRKTRNDAIVSADVAPSIGSSTSYRRNIGVVRSRGWEIQVSGRPVETRMVTGTMGAMLSTSNVWVVRLNPGQAAMDLGCAGISSACNGASPAGNTVTRAVPGYPPDGRWARPIAGFADLDGNGRITPDEVRVADSLVYLGRQEPDYTLTLNPALFLGGHISVYATVHYQHGVSQFNNRQGSFDILSTSLDWDPLFGNNPYAPLSLQAAYAAIGKTPLGLVQTVHTWRLNSVSVAYTVPSAIVQRLRMRSMSLALQGNNVWLKSNYRGKDPNVNAAAVGNTLVDNGSLPQPREWQIQVRVGN